MRIEAAMSTVPTPLQNHLLADLPTEVHERVIPHLVSVRMPLGKVLYESGDAENDVYFPTNCIVSLLYVMKDGASAEISVVSLGRKENPFAVNDFYFLKRFIEVIGANSLQAIGSDGRFPKDIWFIESCG